MEFGWSDQQVEFRHKVRSFLAKRMPAGWPEASAHGPGSDEVVAYSKLVCVALAEERLLVPQWPLQFGGNDGQPWDHYLLGEELFGVGEPRGPQYMNGNWIGPAIMKYGTEDQQALHLPPMASGTVAWCQGFSEPSAGSDLASLRTKAEPSGNGYRINGAKVWTSYAQSADYCFLLARTGNERRSITVFLLPMDTPGIQVKPIKALVCDGSLNEVFFTDVEATPDMILGEPDKGWEVVTWALAQERVGNAKYAFAITTLNQVVEILKQRHDFEGTAVRERAARCLGMCEAARLLIYRVDDIRARQLPPTADSNIARWVQARGETLVAEFITDFLPEALSGDAFPHVKAFYRRAIAAGLGAGAAEIQLNLVAQRYLNLPKAA